MPLDRPYTTVDRVLNEILNDEDDIVANVEDKINLASRYVDEFCGRDFWFHDSPYVGKAYGEFLYLPWPVIEVTGVSIGEDQIPLSDVIVDCRSLECLRFRTLTSMQRVTVTGKFGYPLAEENPLTTPPPTLPASIVRATTLIAAAWTGEYKIERVGLDGQRTLIADSRVPSDAKMMLSRYKVIVV